MNVLRGPQFEKHQKRIVGAALALNLTHTKIKVVTSR
jgi:hypothetical protein